MMMRAEAYEQSAAPISMSGAPWMPRWSAARSHCSPSIRLPHRKKVMKGESTGRRRFHTAHAVMHSSATAA